MNFNTANTTFRQLMGNGLIYRIPAFQRDYSWNADEWDDLWQDILGLFSVDPEPAHYMGYLVLQSSDNKQFNIIDGQQRITTLSVMVLAAIAHLTSLADPADPQDAQRRRAEQLRSSYIGYLDPVSLVPRSKLSLNRHNDRFYQNYLVPLEHLPQRSLNASEHLLRKAFVWFLDHIKRYAGNNGEKIAKFIDTLVDKLFFTIITVTDELNAFKVFETLNARGVRLSSTDLLKNYLFSIVSRDDLHEADLKSLEERWDGIVGLLGSESFPEFLRIFWNSRNRLVRKGDLFKTIRREISTRANAFQLIRDLDKHARIYAALRNPADELWNSEERDNLRQLQMFNVRQPMAVLLAAYERFAERDQPAFARFLRAISVVSFRYNVICGRQSNEQEAIYNSIAQKLTTGGLSTLRGAIAELKHVYPEDAEFRAAFSEKELLTTNSRNKRIVRFILFQIENRTAYNDFEFESSQYSIEHILPEHPAAGWEQFDEHAHDRCVYRLGNMVMLNRSANREVGNLSFDEKTTSYQKSEFATTRRIAENYDSWSVEKIEAQQNWMARQATAIWRIDF